jgi:DNA-binding NarL/FixJ family response regulator
MQQNRKYTVVIFDDNVTLRASLALLINDTSEFEVIGSFDDGFEVLEDIENASPDIVLMDINMPRVNGIEAVRRIKKIYPEQPILMLTAFDDDKNIFNAIAAGANGYILKNAKPEKLLFAMQEVMEGGAPLTPSIAKKVLAHLQSSNEQQEEFNLNPKEKEVIGHLVYGLPYKQIADRMNITYSTVRHHMKNIYRKLHVASMTEVVATAIKNKLV